MTKLNLKWVTDTIGDEYKTWESGENVLLEAQTGTGKSHFIKTKLIPYALEQNKTVIYICNRISLKRQTKIDIATLQGMDLTKCDFEELDKKIKIGNVTIVSYHSIQKVLIDKIYGEDFTDYYKHFDYVVMDECHYILQDASFNNTTYFFQEFINKYNKSAITIFISATMDHVKRTIINKCKKKNNVEPYQYDTGTDYSYITPHFFKENDDIINYINNDNSGQKWLIFVSNADKGMMFSSAINDSKFICSKSNKYNNKANDKVLEKIIYDSKFECKCLIATKALDNGINIEDYQLQNIVLFAWDRIDFIQMLGRKRVNIENAQNVNLYIPQRSISSFNAILNTQIYPKDKLVILFSKDRKSFNREFDTKLKEIGKYEDLFYRNMSDGEWTLNPSGREKLRKQKETFKSIIKKFTSLGKNAYLHVQLNWIGLKYNDFSDNWILEIVDIEACKTLEEYLQKLVGKKLFDIEQKELKQFITKDFDIMVTKLQGRHKRETGSKILNKLLVLCDIPFIIKIGNREIINSNKVTYWTIEQIEIESDICNEELEIA